MQLISREKNIDYEFRPSIKTTRHTNADKWFEKGAGNAHYKDVGNNLQFPRHFCFTQDEANLLEGSLYHFLAHVFLSVHVLSGSMLCFCARKQNTLHACFSHFSV